VQPRRGIPEPRRAILFAEAPPLSTVVNLAYQAGSAKGFP